MAKNVTSPRKRMTRQEMRDLDLEISFLEGLDCVNAVPRTFRSPANSRRRTTRRSVVALSTEGLKVDERLSRLRPDDALVHYNLACSYSLTGQLELAIEALESAINLGYRDFKWMGQDPDLKNLRDHAEYKTGSAPKVRSSHQVKSALTRWTTAHERHRSRQNPPLPHRHFRSRSQFSNSY